MGDQELAECIILKVLLGKCDGHSLPAGYNNTKICVDPWGKHCAVVVIIVTRAPLLNNLTG